MPTLTAQAPEVVVKGPGALVPVDLQPDPVVVAMVWVDQGDLPSRGFSRGGHEAAASSSNS